jgi:hypothetical protein
LKVLTDEELTQTYLANNIKIIRLKGLKDSGTAMTLETCFMDGTQMEVDIVPAYRFKCQQILNLQIIGKVLKTYWSSKTPNKFHEFGELATYDDFLIYDAITPKPKKVLNKSQWRLDFIDMEKRIVYENGCAKMILDLLECFRDSNREIKILSNYALKTVIMLLIKEHSSFIWKEENLSLYFLFALKRLHESLLKRFLPFYFHPMSNIFENLSSAYLQKMETWLTIAIMKMELTYGDEKCRSTWCEFFKQPSKP